MTRDITLVDCDPATARFRRNLARIMRKNRWTIPQLGEAIGADRARTYQLLTGRRSPTLVTLGQLAKSLSCTIGDLCD